MPRSKFAAHWRLSREVTQMHVRKSLLIVNLVGELNMNRAILASLFSFALTTLAASAAELDYPKQVFDAAYTSEDAKTGSHTMRMISDGKGHMRMESNANGMKSTSIMDYPNKVCTTLMEAQKMAIKMPLTASKGQITD